MSRNVDSQGNERGLNEIAQRVGYDVMQLDRISARSWSGAVDVQSVKIRLGLGSEIETLVIFTGIDEDGTPVVAFHGGAPASEALIGGLRRLVNGSLRWKIDGYRNGGGEAQADQGSG